MKSVLNLYKKVGQTPLEVIEKFKLKNPKYNSKRMGYAGRLDPMAEGVLLILSGEENKKIAQYMGFDKEYIAEILLGFSSDSNDVLGVAVPGFSRSTEGTQENSSGNEMKSSVNTLDNKTDVDFEKELKKKIKGFVGKYEQKIPKYSSYKVKGKPMFHYARKGIDVDEVKKNVLIKKIKVNSIYQITNTRLLKYIRDKVGKVNGDFRQEEVLENWSKLLGDENKYYVLNVTLSVSSGTYIRAIADDFGKQMDLGGLLLSLKRTKVGKFRIKGSLRV
jgi:tRNA pseudouridine55 synthase